MRLTSHAEPGGSEVGSAVGKGRRRRQSCQQLLNDLFRDVRHAEHVHVVAVSAVIDVHALADQSELRHDLFGRPTEADSQRVFGTLDPQRDSGGVLKLAKALKVDVSKLFTFSRAATRQN